MNTPLNILVVDDSANHRRAAEILLAGHNLTVVGTYDEAQKLLTPQCDYDKARTILPNLLEEAGLAGYDAATVSDEVKNQVGKLREKSYEDATTYPNFDVVLLDLMMPASSQAQGGEGMQYVGVEMPVGTFLILLAMNAGITKIGMVTDTNHHHHPASAALDPINRSVITVGDTKIFATNYPESCYFDEVTGESVSYEFRQSDEGKEKYPEVGKYTGEYTGLFSGKGWHAMLAVLLKEETQEPAQRGV